MNQTNYVETQDFEKLTNFRDIGGVLTEEGYAMKTGVLFRSDQLSRLTVKDLVLLRKFNIKTICDLRTPKEYKNKPAPRSLITGIELLNIPLHDQNTHDIDRKQLLKFIFSKSGGSDFKDFSQSYYHHIAFDRPNQIKEIFTVLAQEENLPALIHCTAGKDRTGFLSAIIQLLVGIPYETVVQEYLKTNHFYKNRMDRLIKVMRWITLFQVKEERMKFILMAQRGYLDVVHDSILKKYGSIETYLCETCEIEQDVIWKLKNQLLE